MKKIILICICIILIIIILTSLLIIINNNKYDEKNSKVEFTSFNNQSSIEIPPDFLIDKEKINLKKGQTAIVTITAPYKQKFNIYTNNQDVFSISDNMNTRDFTNEFILDNSSRTITIKAENLGTEILNIESVKIIDNKKGVFVKLKEVEISVEE